MSLTSMRANTPNRKARKGDAHLSLGLQPIQSASQAGGGSEIGKQPKESSNIHSLELHPAVTHDVQSVRLTRLLTILRLPQRGPK